MDPTLALVVSVLCVHYIADFWGQTREQAINKSHSLIALADHVMTYTVVMLVFSVFTGIHGILAWVLLNSVLHFITDYGTSKLSSHFWKENDMRSFFLVIGGDQMIHQICLIGTLTFFI